MKLFDECFCMKLRVLANFSNVPCSMTCMFMYVCVCVCVRVRACVRMCMHARVLCWLVAFFPSSECMLEVHTRLARRLQ